MKYKTQEIEWQSSAVAATWPEGSTIMEVLFEKGKPDYRVFRLSTWHRPDWLTPECKNYQKYLTKYRYALISLPK